MGGRVKGKPEVSPRNETVISLKCKHRYMSIDPETRNQLLELFGTLNGYYNSGRPSIVFHLARQSIQQLADQYFSQEPSLEENDAFFSLFTTVWQDMLSKRRFQEAEELWKLALEITYDLEGRNAPRLIHKGTPYYWLGVTQILADKLDDGFLSMHKALKEDERSHSTDSPSAPAYFFVTLDFQQPDQAFGQKVREIAAYLERKIEDYRNTRRGSLTLDQFKTRLLECAALREKVFNYVYLLFRLEKVSRTDKRLLENELSSLLNLGLLFNLCVIIEKTIEYKKTTSGELKYYSAKIKHLISRTSLTLTDSEVSTISKEFDSFGITMRGILDGTHTVMSTKSPIEADLMISLGIRNHGAHEVENQPIVYERWDELSQRVLNVLFFVVEKLY
jgi:hypothetical protein